MVLSRMVKTVLVISFVLMCLFGVSSAAVAADFSSCLKCHDFSSMPNQDVTKFVLPVKDDGSPAGTVANKLNCIKCHRTNIGSIHSTKFATVVVTVYGVVYGGFKSQASLYSPASFIHSRHSNYRATSSTCLTCHGVTSCQTCHLPVAHDQHYLPKAVNPLTGKNIITPNMYVADGITRQYMLTTCAASECHQTMPSPKTVRSDGRDLCFNCHGTGTAGHVDAPAKHATSYLITVPYDCSQCHKKDLVTEHASRMDGNGVPYDCLTCHKSQRLDVQAAIVGKNSKCDACHAAYDHVPLHVSNTIDDKCGTCHIRGNLVPEHLQNSVTQKSTLTCNTCHASSNPDVQYAIAAGNVDCSACHKAAHEFNLVSQVPSDIPLYPGFTWSVPQSAAIWAGEPWFNDIYRENGMRVLSSRETGITLQQVRDYYNQTMSAKGWTLASEDTMNTTNVLNYVYGSRNATVMFYDTEIPGGTVTVPTGYRLDIFYK